MAKNLTTSLRTLSIKNKFHCPGTCRRQRTSLTFVIANFKESSISRWQRRRRKFRQEYEAIPDSALKKRASNPAHPLRQRALRRKCISGPGNQFGIVIDSAINRVRMFRRNQIFYLFDAIQADIQHQQHFPGFDFCPKWLQLSIGNPSRIKR